MLCACSDGKAGTLPTESPTTLASQTPTAPSVSPRTSLETALRTYFHALYAAGLDPAEKTDELAELIDTTCECYRVVTVLREEAREGRYIDYTYTLSDLKVVAVDSRSGDVNYTVTRSAGAERDRNGRVLEQFPPTTEKYSAHFVRSNSTWLLQRLTRFR